MQTKEVQGFFGPKQVTREDFIKQWRTHAADVYSLTLTTEDYEAVKALLNTVAEMAGRKFDAMA